MKNSIIFVSAFSVVSINNWPRSHRKGHRDRREISKDGEP